MAEDVLESWRRVFRDGFAPQLSDVALGHLRRALGDYDRRLLFGATCVPPPVHCLMDWPVEQACAVVYSLWQEGAGPLSVGEASELFARACFRCDQLVGEAAGCRHFLAWFDDGPAEDVRPALAGEIDYILARRRDGSFPCGPEPSSPFAPVDGPGGQTDRGRGFDHAAGSSGL